MATRADSNSKLRVLALLLALRNSMPLEAGQSHSQSTPRSEVPEVQTVAISESGLAPIPHPDLSKADAAIKEQIEAAQSALNSSLERHETASGQLAQLYGDLG